MAYPKISTQYDHHQGPELHDFEPTRTKQEFLEESDINFIVNQYETTGLIPQAGPEGVYGDFSAPELSDYHQALGIVAGAKELFDRVPAKVRERFRNDPAELILFCQDPANTKEAHELGLLRDDYVSPTAPPATPGPAAPVPGTDLKP